MATTDAALNGRSRRLSPQRRKSLEQDIAEIRAQLGSLATKDDVEALTRHIDSRTADILEAIHGKDIPHGAAG